MKPRVEYVLVCEDIRQEIGNKPSAMGIFSGDIVVREFPHVFPKLCFLVHLTLTRPTPALVLDASISHGEKSTILVQAERVATRGKRGVDLQFMLSPFRIEQSGKFEFILGVNGYQHRHAFSVKKAVDPAIFGK
jgi:hypothetical protein